jgi:hypothetical protein
MALKTTSATLTSTKTFQLKVSPNTTGCIFESQNEFIATVSSSGLITANLVGETNIIVTNDAEGFIAKCKVTVIPEHLLFQEPYLIFDSQKEDIMDYETRILYEESDTSLLYAGENSSITALIYFFDESLYYECDCLIPANEPEDFEAFIAERYFFLETDNEVRYFMTPDSKTIVVVESGIEIDSDTYYFLYYFAYPTSKSKEIIRSKSKIIRSSGFLSKFVFT